ncbi:MAG: hypothetical protein Q8S92_22260 [Hydrogenophaga sp.]|jgi:hypothetical protein|uniref:hypothetical protein n=1 Tax=Hydrogenophaga sp. TaxID=1904254 RepID=UPI00273252FF|nr:hypothetical protein [Hydrogenophaga sp.]MDP3351718.1 hypothetical protein [Hydrogenophaga sp.]
MTTFITKLAYQLIPGDQVQLASHPDLQASATEERTHSPVEIAGRVIDGLISIRLVDMEPVLLGANDVLKLKVPAILEFPHRLLLSENAADERLDVGFAFSGSIVRDNLVSEGNTFSHPLDIYGLNPDNHKALIDFNKAIDEAVEDAINAFALRIQNHVGCTDGGFAGQVFSHDARVHQVRNALIEYAVLEVNFNKQSVQREQDTPTPATDRPDR